MAGKRDSVNKSDFILGGLFFLTKFSLPLRLGACTVKHTHTHTHTHRERDRGEMSHDFSNECTC